MPPIWQLHGGRRSLTRTPGRADPEARRHRAVARPGGASAKALSGMGVLPGKGEDRREAGLALRLAHTKCNCVRQMVDSENLASKLHSSAKGQRWLLRARGR